jgi:hypothetical protein
MGRQGRILSADDLHGEEVHTGAFKGWPQSAHLVEHDPERPDITFERIRSALYDFRRQIIRRADHGSSHFNGMAKDASDSEITELDDVLLGKEDVLALDIAMKNLSVMHVLHSKANLSEPVHDLRLREVFKQEFSHTTQTQSYLNFVFEYGINLYYALM